MCITWNLRSLCWRTFIAEPLIKVIINYCNALFSLEFRLGCVKIWVCPKVCLLHGRKFENYWSPITGTQNKSSKNSKIQINDDRLQGFLRCREIQKFESLKIVFQVCGKLLRAATWDILFMTLQHGNFRRNNEHFASPQPDELWPPLLLPPSSRRLPS